MAEVTSGVVSSASVLFTLCMEKPFISWSLCVHTSIRAWPLTRNWSHHLTPRWFPVCSCSLFSAPHRGGGTILFEMLIINLLCTLLLSNRRLGNQQLRVPWAPCCVQASCPGPNCGAGSAGFTWNSHRGRDGSQPIFSQHAVWPLRKQPQRPGDHL